MKLPISLCFRQRGVTLIELIIVTVILAIIIGIAVPSYQTSITKNNRSLAKAELLSIFSKQEQYFINNKGYATNLTDLNYPANEVYVNKHGDVTGSDIGAVYKFQFAAGATSSSFTLEAIGLNSQADDTVCGTFTLDESGMQGATGSNGVSCW